MKKLIFLHIFLISTIYSYACTCIKENTVDNFVNYEVVFKAKVIAENEHYPNSKTPKIISLEIIDIFKGNPKKTLIIERGKCQTIAPKLNTEWIIFASKDSKGNFILEDCNASFSLVPHKYIQESNKRFKKWNQNIQDQVNIISFLSKTDNINFNFPKIISSNNQKLINFYKSIPEENFINDFGIYIIEFNTDRSVKDILVLNSLGEEIDTIFKIFYKHKTDWTYREKEKRENNFEKGDAVSIIITKNQIFSNI